LVGSPNLSIRPFILKKIRKMKSGSSSVRYKLTVHEEVTAIEAVRRVSISAGGNGPNWAVVDVNEDQREAIIAAGYSYVRVMTAGVASRPENRLVAFTWLTARSDLDRLRRETAAATLST
jgi:hypothetical protein